MEFKLMDLPFSKTSMPGFLTPETFDFHYGKHHQTYVNKLNELLPGSGFENATLEEIILKATGPVFNNGAQVWNHDFYWKSLSPELKKIGSKTQSMLEATWGSVDQFKKDFEGKAVTVFGSGWCWLAYDPQLKSLKIIQTSNAENPLKQSLVPLLTCDVWEHAYYIDYRNSRPNYLAKWWDHVNWDFVEANLVAHTK